MSQRRLKNFWTIRLTFCIQRGYNFIWDKLQGLLPSYEMILDLDGGCQGLDWTFVGNSRLTMISTNDVYHKMIDK